LSEELPKYYFKLYEKTYQVQENIGSFVSGTAPYVDLIFDVGMDKEVEGGNAVFSFSRNNQFRISSLPRGRYMIQVYTVQDSDSNSKLDNAYDYRVLTYGGYKEFFMGLPTIVSGEFANSSNIFLIENINLTSEYDEADDKLIKNIRVNFITKAEQSLNLTKQNIVPELYEGIEKDKTIENSTKNSNSGKVKEKRENIIEEVTNLKLSKSEQRDFQFPLDVVFLVDTSRSMGPYINDVKKGLADFIKDLERRGFDLKYNLITFGSPQMTYVGNGGRWTTTQGVNWNDKVAYRYDYHVDRRIYHYKNNPNGHIINGNPNAPFAVKYKEDWFDGKYKNFAPTGEVYTSDEHKELYSALNDIQDDWGYIGGPENAFHAIKFGIDHLKNKGRYLNFENEIVKHENMKKGYIPSQKMIVLLTDENASTYDIHNLGNNYNKNNIVLKLSEELSEYSIVLNSIYKPNVYYKNQNEYNLYEKTGLVAEKRGNYIYLKDRLDKIGEFPKDSGGKYISEFALQGLEKLFNIYSIDGDIAKSLSHSANNIGIVQRWIMSYRSSFIDSDGLKRQVLFSIDDIVRVDKTKELFIKPFVRGTGDDTDRHYIVPEQKIDGYFINPSGKKLAMMGGKIELKARVWSQYKNEDGKPVNYPIIRGTYTISNGKNTILIDSKEEHEGRRVLIKEIENNNRKEYEISVSLNQREFLEKFPINTKLDIELSALTRDLGIRLYADKIDILEQDAPKVVGIKLINQTARELLEGLNNIGLGMSLEALEENTSSYIGDFSDSSKIKKLNVKEKDKILVELKIEEESFKNWYKTNDDINKNNVFTINGVDVTNLEIGEKVNGIVTIKGEMNLKYITKKDIKIQLTDDLGNKMPSSLDFDVLEFSEEIDKIKLKANENPVSTDYKNYYKHKNGEENQDVTLSVDIPEKDKEEILAYIAVFNFDKEKSDKKIDASYPSLDDNVKYLLSLDGDFDFKDGEHQYLIYPINKAGAIKDTKKTESIKVIKELHSKVIEGVDKFYIDTVKPELSGEIIGTKDRNWGELPQCVIDIVKNRDEFKNETYKSGDTLAVKVTLTEFNPYKVEVFKKDNENVLVASETEKFDEIELEIGKGHKEDDKYIVRATDKAGNIKEIELGLKYNNDVPKSVEVGIIEDLTAEKDGKTYKFINKEKGKLTSKGTGQEPVYIVAKRGIFSWRGGNLGKLEKIGDDDGLVSEEGKQTLTFYSFASNGKFVTSTEKVVVDNSINDSKLVKKYTAEEEKYIDLGEIGEFVGLADFKILNSSIVDKIDGVAYEENKVISCNNSENSSINLKRDWNLGKSRLKLVNDVPGRHTLKLMVRDKLGNENEVEYIVNVISNIELIGKKEGASKKITTHIEINNISNMEIKNRE
jgi:hypothetical protein